MEDNRQDTVARNAVNSCASVLDEQHPIAYFHIQRLVLAYVISDSGSDHAIINHNSSMYQRGMKEVQKVLNFMSGHINFETLCDVPVIQTPDHWKNKSRPSVVGIDRAFALPAWHNSQTSTRLHQPLTRM